MKRLTLVLSLLLVSLLAAPPAFAGWMWSPQTGWVGATGAVKDTPEEQLVFAVAFFDRKDYHRAREEFKKLLKAYKNSRDASEAQYYVGRCEEEMGDYYKAFLAYRKTVQTYPSSKRFDEILEREYQIGNYFLSGKRRKLFGTAALIPARDKSIEIFQAIVDDGPFSEQGQLAQYKLGLAHLALKDYELSVSAFERLISRYPNSPLVDDARFRIAQASLQGTFKPEYDQAPTDQAVKELKVFLQENPKSEFASEASKRVKELIERRAQHEYQVGQFYEQRRHATSALLYYQTIVEQFAQTSWAAKAAERIQILQHKL